MARSAAQQSGRLGVHFRRSQIIAGYIADFYCHSGALVVEVDGRGHENQRGYDHVRAEAFAKLGIRTIRVTNQEVGKDLSGVVKRIKVALKPNP